MASVTVSEIVMRHPGAAQPTLRNLSLEIEDGQFFVLLGPSGCGKSTLLKLIAGLEEPDEGAIHLGDRLINFVPPGDRNVAMVFQNYALYPHMTVRENILFPLKMRKTDGARARELVEQAARHLELEELLDRNVGDLSGGQRQRVAVARAIVREPSVTLMDEPLSNLDARLRLQTREALLRLHREVPGTVIYVTHDQVEAMTMGDQIGVMKDGVLVQCGTPTEIYCSPVNRFVAEFVGSPPMNFVDGRLGDRDGSLRFLGAGIDVAIGGSLAAELRRRSLGSAEVTLGVRPEDLTVRAPNGDGGGTPGPGWHVSHIETLGVEGVLALRPGDGTEVQLDDDRLLRLRVPRAREYSQGQAVVPTVASEEIYLFDGDGRNVLAA